MVKQVILLAICQALILSTTTLTMTSSALVGLAMAPTRGLATLPLGVCYTVIMLTLIPASLAMQRYGRKRGFVVGAVSGVLGGLLAGVAIYRGDFVLFCIASALQGVSMACGQFLRFAAAEVATEAYRSRAISWVLAGGLAAAFIGPSIARYTRDFLSLPPFTVSFTLIALLSAGVLLCMAFLNLPGAAPPGAGESRRPLARIMLLPGFIAAVVCAMIAYGSMNLLMTSTPLAMRAHGHAFHQTASVIQWHIVGMFAPSFFTGHLIHRFGVLTIMAIGVVFLALCVLASWLGQDYAGFLLALVSLGIGWNFLYIGGTTMLTEIYRPEEKGMVQGLNDFLVFFAVAFTALMSGYLHHQAGWVNLNLLVMPALGLALLSIFWVVLSRQRAKARV